MIICRASPVLPYRIITRCRSQSLPTLQSTSFGSFWSENFLKLRSTLGSGPKFKLLGSNIFEPSFGGINGKWVLRPITRTAQSTRDTQSSKPCNLQHELLDGTVTATTITKSPTNFFKTIHYCDAQQKMLESQHLKHLVKIFVIDVETTGFCRKGGRIVEIALRDLLGGKNSCFQTLVNPGQDIRNSYVHGITSDMVNQAGVPRMEDLIPILKQYIESRHVPGGLVLFVAHNGHSFDFPFLFEEFGRCSQEIPSNWLFMDTLPLARELMKSNGSKLYPKISLQALREYYGIPLVDSNHRAMSDVNLLSSIFERLTFDLKLTVVNFLERSKKASDLIIKLKKKKKKKS